MSTQRERLEDLDGFLGVGLLLPGLLVVLCRFIQVDGEIALDGRVVGSLCVFPVQIDGLVIGQ